MPTPALKGGRVVPILLALLLLVAGSLRVLGLDHGLPHVVGVDEGFEIHRALRLGLGEIDLERVAKGGFFYLLFIEFGFYYLGLRLTGTIDSAVEFAERFAADPTPFWLIARFTHAALALLAVLWTYRLGRRAYGARAGLIGAAVVAVSNLHVAQSHEVGVDLPMVFLALITLELALRWSDPNDRVWPLPLGLAFGFAVMTKIVAIALLAPIALANFLRYRRDGLRRALLGREISIAYGIAGVVFMAGNPGFLAGFGEFVRNAWVTLFGAGRAVEGYVEAGAAVNLWAYYGAVLLDDLGPGLLVVCAAGAAWALWRRERADLLLFTAGAAFYLLIAGARTAHLYYPRYALPLIPLLALLAGRLLSETVDRLPLPAAARGALLAAAVVVLAYPTGSRALEGSLRMTRDDTRVRARLWMEVNLPPASPVFLIGNPIVDTAPNLSLPLRNSDENLDHLIARLAAEEPSKARFLELRKRQADGVPFDLRTVRHFEPNRGLEDYERDGVRYFALTGDRFDPARLERDRKHAPEVLASRARLRAELERHPRAKLIFELDPETARLAGPRVEIFELTPAAAPMESG